MKEMMNTKGCRDWSDRSRALAVHDASHGITKSRPKVRIVHLFAPEIIKTDAANFRDLVQRLTGKPTETRGGEKKARSAEVDTQAAVEPSCKRVDSAESQSQHRYRNSSSWLQERINKELEEVEEGRMWLEESSAGGFLGGLGDADHGFFQGLSDFPLSSSHMELIMEEVHVS